MRTCRPQAGTAEAPDAAPGAAAGPVPAPAGRQHVIAIRVQPRPEPCPEIFC